MSKKQGLKMTLRLTNGESVTLYDDTGDITEEMIARAANGTVDERIVVLDYLDSRLAATIEMATTVASVGKLYVMDGNATLHAGAVSFLCAIGAVVMSGTTLHITRKGKQLYGATLVGSVPATLIGGALEAVFPDESEA